MSDYIFEELMELAREYLEMIDAYRKLFNYPVISDERVQECLDYLDGLE